MEAINSIISLILAICGAMMAYKFLYLLIGALFPSKKYPPAKQMHSFSFVIAARNEEGVIADLIDSIRAQDYRGRTDHIFVVADNCTDSTADIARAHGAVVYERNDPLHARKGYALEFLFDCIDRDYGISSSDGYFVFDADNLLSPDFVTRMNEAFDAGYRVVTSYRSAKNFDTNFISAAYGLHFCNNSLGKHRPRSLLGIGTHLTGTGYLIASDLLADGWHYVNFTEDDEITMALSGKGVKIGYCEAAEFFDEQPHDMKTVLNQRVRWAKGRLVNFFKYGGLAFRGIFTHRSFTCYDMFVHYFPYGLFSWILGIIYPLFTLASALIHPTAAVFIGMAKNILAALGSMYVSGLVTGILTAVRERSHIRCSTPLLVLYVALFPWYTMISIPVYIVAVFKKVAWTPIKHDDARKLETIIKK